MCCIVVVKAVIKVESLRIKCQDCENMNELCMEEKY